MSASIMVQNEMGWWMARTLLSRMTYETMRQMGECLDGYQSINPIVFGEGMGLSPERARHVAEFGRGDFPTARILQELFSTNKTIWDAYIVLKRMNSRAARVLENFWSETCQAQDCGTRTPRSVDVNSEPSHCLCGQCYNNLNMAPSLSSGSSNSRHGYHGINIPPSPPPPLEDHTDVKGRSPASGKSTQCSEFSPPEDFSDKSWEETIKSFGQLGDSADNKDLHFAQSSNPVPQNGWEGPNSFPVRLQQRHRNVPASDETHHSLPARFPNLPGSEQRVCQRRPVLCPPSISHEPSPQVREEFQQRSGPSPQAPAAAAVPKPRADSQRGNPARARRGITSQDKYMLIVCGEKYWSDAQEEAVKELLDTLQNNAIPYVACSPRGYPWSWHPESLVNVEVIMQNKSSFLHQVFKQATAIIPVITQGVQRYVEPRNQRRSIGEARENAMYIAHKMLEEITRRAGNTRFFPLIMDQLGASSKHNFDWLRNTIVYHFSVDVQRRDLLRHLAKRLNP